MNLFNANVGKKVRFADSKTGTGATRSVALSELLPLTFALVVFICAHLADPFARFHFASPSMRQGDRKGPGYQKTTGLSLTS